jgi:hypothetical protein
MEVIKLKKLIASVNMKDDNNNSDEPSITEGEESDSPSPSSPSLSSIPINSIIPDSSILDSMPKLLHDSFVSNFESKLTHTNIAYDGYVCNFPLPQVIKIEVDVN